MGKATTAAQMLLVMATLGSPGLAAGVGGAAFRVMWHGVAALTVVSGLGYLRRGLARAAGVQAEQQGG